MTGSASQGLNRYHSLLPDGITICLHTHVLIPNARPTLNDRMPESWNSEPQYQITIFPFPSRPLPLLTPHNSSHSMPNRRTRALNLSLRQRARDAHFQRWARLPLLLQLSWRDAEGAGHGFQARDEDAICEGLENRVSMRDWEDCSVRDSRRRHNLVAKSPDPRPKGFALECAAPSTQVA